MNSRPIIKTKEKPIIRTGSILIAQPFWQDERYRRSVIMMLNHDDRESVGIILNKQSNLCVIDALPDLNIAPPLYFGGPFNPEIISFIHSSPAVPQSVYLGNEMFYGGDYEGFKEMLIKKQLKSRKIKFYSGFVRWSPGQLDEEFRENKWWTSEITAREFFNTSFDALWVQELLLNGHIYGIMNDLPDPNMN